MTKGRKPLPPATQEGPQFVTETPEEVANHPAVSPEVRAWMEDVYALGQDMGDMRTATFYEIISDSVKLTAYERAKKSKSYRFLVNPKTRNHFASLEEFCEVNLGTGHRRMQQLSSNRSLLGREAFEQGQRLGLRQVDYDAIKALPAPKQEIIRQAADQATSRDELTQLINELAAMDQAEIADKDQQIAERDARIVAKDRVIEDNSKTMNRLREQIAGIKPPTPEFVREASLRDLDHEALGCAARIATSLRAAMVKALEAEDADAAHGALARQACQAAVGRVLAAARETAEAFGIAYAGPEAMPEARDEIAETQAIWDKVNADIEAEQAAAGVVTHHAPN